MGAEQIGEGVGAAEKASRSQRGTIKGLWALSVEIRPSAGDAGADRVQG